MVWHPQNVPEKVPGMSSILIGAEFDTLFSKIFTKQFSLGAHPESFFDVEEWREEK